MSDSETTSFLPGITEWELADAALAHRDRVFLWGPPGTGKTFAGLTSQLNGREAIAITLTPETPAAEPRGMYMPKGSEFVWSDGVFVRAMRTGARLVINEVSHASEDVMALLYPILESADTSELTLPTGEVVKPAPGFQVVVTDNHDASTLSDALQSRLSTKVHLPLPHPKAMERVHPRYRQAALDSFTIPEGDPRRTTLRAWLNVTELAQKVDEQLAFALTFGREQGQMLWEALRVANAADDLKLADPVRFNGADF